MCSVGRGGEILCFKYIYDWGCISVCEMSMETSVRPLTAMPLTILPATTEKWK